MVTALAQPHEELPLWAVEIRRARSSSGTNRSQPQNDPFSYMQEKNEHGKKVAWLNRVLLAQLKHRKCKGSKTRDQNG